MPRSTRRLCSPRQIRRRFKGASAGCRGARCGANPPCCRWILASKEPRRDAEEHAGRGPRSGRCAVRLQRSLGGMPRSTPRLPRAKTDQAGASKEPRRDAEEHLGRARSTGTPGRGFKGASAGCRGAQRARERYIEDAELLQRSLGGMPRSTRVKREAMACDVGLQRSLGGMPRSTSSATQCTAGVRRLQRSLGGMPRSTCLRFVFI